MLVAYGFWENYQPAVFGLEDLKGKASKPKITYTQGI